MKKRYLHLDFKGIVPQIRTLGEHLMFFKECGFDGVVFEFDCRVACNSLPDAGSPAYTTEQAAMIVRQAESLGLETIPLMQCIGHLEWLLGEKEYASFRENGTLTLCPNAPGAKNLILGWMKELREIFPNSKYIHIGGDEVAHLCECPACMEECRSGKTKFDVYLRHVSEICSAAASMGFSPIVWGDMFLKEEDPASRIRALPSGTVVVDWKYWGEGPYESTRKLQQSGREIWGASGVQCAWYEHYRQLLPFYEDRFQNVLGWNKFEGNVIHTVWTRSGSKWGLFPPCIPLSLPVFIAAGNPQKWLSHPWKHEFDEMMRLFRRGLEFELERLPEQIRHWPCRSNLEEQCRDFLIFGIEYQILVNRYLENLSIQDSLLVSRKYVGWNPDVDRKYLHDIPAGILAGLQSLMDEIGRFFDRCGFDCKEEFTEEFSSIFRHLKIKDPV